LSAAISVDRLSKWYGSRLAVDGVSFEVGAGEVMGLLGPNGSGKTTILRILTGYLRPSRGTARIGDLDVVDASLEARRHIGYVPEDAPLYDWMRVREFLDFMARLKGTPPPTRHAVDEIVQRLALGEVIDLTIGKLSRGYRQRVAIAQALLNDPSVLVLDEPTNGLDPRQIIEMRRLIRSLAGAHTVLITSHILGEIEKVADRAAILVAGRLLTVHSLRKGTPPGRLCVRARDPADALRACLGRVPGVHKVTIAAAPSAEGIVTCTVDVEAPETAEAVAAALAGGGLHLLELTAERADLETVFLSLTG